MEDKILLEMRNVKKFMNQRFVLENVDLQISAGRMIGVIGDNGRGKTTLLKLMAGLRSVSSGDIIRNTDKISYVSSGEDFYDWMKVKDALQFYDGYYERFHYGKAVGLLEESEIFPGDRIQKMSRGQRERLCLILAISQEAELYLMDEPLSGIDPYFKKDMRQFLLKNLPEGATVVMATHLLKEMEQLFDEVIFVMGDEICSMETETIREKYGKSVEQYYLERMRHGDGKAGEKGA